MDLDEIEKIISTHNPCGLLVIPYDNPTGQFLTQREINNLGKICIKHNIWMVSDEAYRQLYYNENESSSIWKITENEVTGISGSRISIESASKVWNACGLRIGGLVTDSKTFHIKAVSEYTTNLSANAIGQEIFGALAHEPHDDLKNWYNSQRNYYHTIMQALRKSLMKEIPGLIVTKPEAAIYIVIDFRKICDKSFDAKEFVSYCASEGKVKIYGKYFTLLLAPMNGFYSEPDKGKTQMRIAMVEPSALIKKTAFLLKELYYSYHRK